MSGIQISLLTYALLTGIALSVAVVIWLLPKVIDAVTPKGK